MKYQLNRMPKKQAVPDISVENSSNMRKVTSTFVIACLSLSLVGCSHSMKESDPRLDPPLVTVTQVGLAHGQLTSYTGIVKARVESNVGFRVSGKITQRLVDIGQSVKRGQPLFKLDPTDLSHTVKAKQEAVESQISSVESRRGDLEAARARLIQAEADERRYKSAAAVGVVTDQAYDQYKAAADSARAYFRAAQAEVNASKEQASALVAQKKIAQNESDYATLSSDVDGVVTDVMAEPGQVVAIGQGVVKIAHSGPREASVSLPETVRPLLGQVVEARVYDAAIPACKARLRQLSDAADPLTRTFEARYVLSGVAAGAPLGSTVAVFLEPSSSRKQATVPLTALIDKGHGTGVWTIDSKKSVVHFRSVVLGALGNEEAIITGGLRPGEMFVAQGAHLLHENDKVRIAIATKNGTKEQITTISEESK